MGALAGLLAVAATAAFLWLPGLQQPAAPAYQAQLATQDQVLRVAARIDGRDMEIALESGAAPDDRDWEIWWVKPDGSAPVSIGLVPRDGTLRMTLPDGLDPSAEHPDRAVGRTGGRIADRSGDRAGRGHRAAHVLVIAD